LCPYCGDHNSKNKEPRTISATHLLINLLGAVALLLWGMRMVRTGIERAFGSDLRQAIGRAVSNRFRALIVGIGVTGVLQSSTATAFMVTSFASRGLMATAPALAVMLGADIGTTLVAQILSFDISLLSPVLVFGGMLAHSTSKRTLIRQLGRAAIGLGIMLLALKLIVASSEPMRDSTVLQEIFVDLANETVLTVLLAALLTWLAHSSLAVVLLVMSFASGGATSLPLAFALVIGANLGGTLPPIIATWAEGAVARRVPLGNAIFKVIGCILILPLIGIIAPYIEMIEPDAARQVVNFHTLFNLTIGVLFIFATDHVARLTTALLPPEPVSSDPGVPRHLDRANIGKPTIALASAARETMRMGDLVEQMIRRSIDVLRIDDRNLASEVARIDDSVDRMHEAIKLYVTEASRERLDEDDSRRVTNILTFTTDLEHIGDIIENLMDIASKKIKRKMHFSPDGMQEIEALHHRVADNLKLALGIFISDDVKLAHQLLAEKKIVNAMERRGAENHMARLREGRPESIETSALHMDILRDLKRIHSHIVAICYPILEQAGELDKAKAAIAADSETPRDDEK